MTIPRSRSLFGILPLAPVKGRSFTRAASAPSTFAGRIRASNIGGQLRLAHGLSRSRGGVSGGQAQFQASGDPSKPIAPDVPNNTISRTIELFISNKRTQGLAGNALKKYERELGRFEEFMAKRGRYFPHEIRLEDLTEFRVEWEGDLPIKHHSC